MLTAYKSPRHHFRRKEGKTAFLSVGGMKRMELSSSFHLANNGTAGLGWLAVSCTTVIE